MYEKSIRKALYLIEKSILDRNVYTKFLYLTEKYVRKVYTKSLYLTEKSISNRNVYPKCIYLKKMSISNRKRSNPNVYV